MREKSSREKRETKEKKLVERREREKTKRVPLLDFL